MKKILVLLFFVIFSVSCFEQNDADDFFSQPVLSPQPVQVGDIFEVPNDYMVTMVDSKLLVRRLVKGDSIIVDSITGDGLARATCFFKVNTDSAYGYAMPGIFNIEKYVMTRNEEFYTKEAFFEDLNLTFLGNGELFIDCDLNDHFYIPIEDLSFYQVYDKSIIIKRLDLLNEFNEKKNKVKKLDEKVELKRT